jgi:anti-sigma regulatory factor (Ser/Thr protein kinase)
VVISGADREQSHASPVRLIDAVRLALAEIEEYTRVDVDVPLDLLVAPSLVSDIVLICGELLENATTFSPPHTRVTVIARAVPGGARLTIADHGIGMPDERLAEENSRIAHRERLDLVPTQVLGLFVVGRLARRHGMTVDLSHTPGGGVTVQVGISSLLLAGDLLVSDQVAPRTTVSVEWSAPQQAAPASRHSTVRESISRVSDVMSDPHTWNGFDVPRQLPAGPPAQAPQAAPASPGGLRRRIPGTHLTPEPAERPAIAAQLTDHDADAARLLVEQLEFGVTQALQETSPHHRQ